MKIYTYSFLVGGIGILIFQLDGFFFIYIRGGV